MSLTSRANSQSLACSVFLALLVGFGCQHSRTNRTEEQFHFIQPSLSIQTVTNRLGPPDRLTGRGVIFMEYDLADGSHMMILPCTQPQRLDPFGIVCGMAHRRGKTWTWLVQKAYP